MRVILAGLILSLGQGTAFFRPAIPRAGRFAAILIMRGEWTDVTGDGGVMKRLVAAGSEGYSRPRRNSMCNVDLELSLVKGPAAADSTSPQPPPPTSGVRTTAEDWRELKVPELKAELRARGLRVSGTKPELIQRLMVAAADTEDTGVDGTLVSVAMLKQLKQVEHAHKPVRCEREVYGIQRCGSRDTGISHAHRWYI